MSAEPAESELTRAMRGFSHSRALQSAIAELAGRQYGVVSRCQLIDIGLGEDTIDRWIAVGRLHRLYQGVYAVGHTRVCREGRWLAAVLACGEGAVLSHRSAAALWGMRHYEGRPEVTTRHAHRRGGLLVARRRALEPDEITKHRGIPTTTPARTLLDLGECLTPPQLDKAIREADYLRIVDFAVLIDRYRGRRGIANLRRAMRTATSADHTRSELEDRFRTLILDAKLPTPVFNATLELGKTTIEVDALWPNEKLIVELDGWAAHGTRHRFHADRRRDRAASSLGYLTLRYTWDDLCPNAIRDLGQLLSGRRPRRFGRLRSAARRA